MTRKAMKYYYSDDNQYILPDARSTEILISDIYFNNYTDNPCN